MESTGEKQNENQEVRLVTPPSRAPDDPLFFFEYLEKSVVKVMNQEVVIHDILLGRGGFGTVNFGRMVATGCSVAVKSITKEKCALSYYNELNFYCNARNWPGFPKLFTACEDKERKILALELLGPSLEDIFSSRGRVFSLKTVVMLAEQMITRVEFLHSKGYVHRDMKPDNFVFGPEENSPWIYLIDFGNVKRYLDDNNEHIPENQNRPNGTIRYLSLNAHRGKEVSRRDDLMSLFYIFIYFLRGSLPWQGMPLESVSKTMSIVQQLKLQYTPGIVTDCPIELQLYYQHVDDLEFTSTPDYAYLRGLFLSLAGRNGFTHDYIYDWTQTAGYYHY